MRTVKGPTDRVVIVGAGLAGLSAALRLAGAGREVTVLEKEPVPGGRAGRVDIGGYRLDNGPTVLTMPDLIADAFAAVGEEMSDWLELTALDPAYRAFYPDGSRLDVLTDPAAMAQHIHEVIGPQEAAGYERFVEFAAQLYRLEMTRFIDRNIDTPFDLVHTDLARIVALGGFRRLSSKIGDYLKDPRTQRVFSFQALYAGLAPQDALALYAVIAYMDSVAGVFAPTGGMSAVPEAMAAAAAKHGVAFHYETTVTSVEHSGGRASAVITEDGRRIAADAVILNPDLPVAYRDLLGKPHWRSRFLKYSPSCYLLLAGSDRDYPQTVHHNIHFGHGWRSVFEEIIDRKVPMSDASLLVSHPTHTDPSLAPPGKHVYYVLFPTPNLTADIDWREFAPRYREKVLQTLEERGYRGFSEGIEVEDVTTPQDWADRGMEAGAPFSAAHTFFQTGPFRPSNMWGDNVVFTGSGTQPGVGVPIVLMSGRLAAERVTGPDRSYRSRAY